MAKTLLLLHLFHVKIQMSPGGIDLYTSVVLGPWFVGRSCWSDGIFNHWNYMYWEIIDSTHYTCLTDHPGHPKVVHFRR